MGSRIVAEILIISLFIIGSFFLNASQILNWLIFGGKPRRDLWKRYGIIGILIYLVVFILANTIL